MHAHILFAAVLVALAAARRVGALQPDAAESVVSVRENKFYDGKALTLPVDAAAGVAMYQHWMEQAFSGLFASVAANKLRWASRGAQAELTKCSEASFDVIQHANCLKNLIEHTAKRRRKKEKARTDSKDLDLSTVRDSQRLSKYGRKKAAKNDGDTKTASAARTRRKRDKLEAKSEALAAESEPRPLDTVALRRVSKADYSLLDSNHAGGGLTALGAVAKLLTKTLAKARNKTHVDDWKTTITRIQNIVLKRRNDKKKAKSEKMASGHRNAHSDHDDNSEEGYGSAKQRDFVAFRGLKQKEADDLDEVVSDPKRLGNYLTAAKRERATKRMDAAIRVSDLVREGVKLGMAMAGENTTEFERKTLKLVSPRFLSVVPEEVDNSTLNLLSPSLFSMHDGGDALERAASVPRLANSFSLADHGQWMNLIMEAAGINEKALELEHMESEKDNAPSPPPPSPPPLLDAETWRKAREVPRADVRGEDGQPLYFTKHNVTERFGDFERRKIETFEKLIATYSKQQLAEMNSTGYALMTRAQLELLYGPHSPYNHSATLRRLLPLDAATVHDGIERDAMRTAEMRSFQVRQKDIVLSPVLLSPLVLAAPALNQAIILSPLVLSPVILTPSVLGPIILSPWVFLPIILSPRVLSPVIVNPLLFAPVILSPLVLHPFILAPGVFIPFVLTPFVLSPLILSPQVFTPIVLSPLVLSPLILNPMVGSPLVLSPFVLTPVILSPMTLFALVLSPYALSPIIESKLIASALILSPSWLS